MPKPLEIVHFGYHTDGLSGLVVGILLSIFVPVGYICVHNYLGSQTAYLKKCI